MIERIVVVSPFSFCCHSNTPCALTRCIRPLITHSAHWQSTSVTHFAFGQGASLSKYVSFLCTSAALLIQKTQKEKLRAASRTLGYMEAYPYELGRVAFDPLTFWDDPLSFSHKYSTSPIPLDL